MPIRVHSNGVFNPYPWPIPIPAFAEGAAHNASVNIATRAQPAVAAGQSFDNTIGNVEPVAANTGYRGAFGDLEVYTGTSTPGPGTYEGVRFDVFIDTTASGYTFRDCLFRGPNSTPASGRGLLRCDNANSANVVVEYCEFTPQVASNRIDGIQGKRYSAWRCKVHDVVDFFRIRNTQSAGGLLEVEIIECYGYDHTWFPDSGQNDGQTHNDGIQIEGGDGTGTMIRANALWGRRYSTRSSTSPAPPDRGTGTEDNGRYAQGALAGIQLTSLGGLYCTDLDIWDNWIRGYERGINAGSANNTNVGRWWRNKFDDAQGERSGGSLSAGTGYTITMDPTTTCDTGDGGANQNIYMATATGIAAGTPVTVRRNQ